MHYELRERMRSPDYLPTREEVQATCEDYQRFEWIGDDGLSYAENFVSPDDFELMYPNGGAFEILNKEFITALGEYIASQIAARDSKEPISILELGAGSGRLAHFLKRELEKRVPGRFTYHATDNGDWGIHDPFKVVETLGNEEALQKYEPTLVLVSWMPFGIDWSETIRQTRSVEEYFLIGEKGGCVGSGWETWGEWDSFFEEDQPPAALPWEADHFEGPTLLREVSNCQINRGCEADWIRSRTYSFKRAR